MTTILQLIIVYALFFLWKPVGFYLYDQMVYSMKSNNKRTKPKATDVRAIPNLPLSQKISKLQNYAFTRANRKLIYLIAYFVVPLIPVGVAFFLKKTFNGILLSLLLYIVFVIILFYLEDKNYKQELNLINIILQFKRNQMGLRDKNTTVFEYQNEFEIKSWNEENNFPAELLFRLPPDFNKESRIKFMEELSKRVGRNQYWKSKLEDWDNDEYITVKRAPFLKEPAYSFVNNFVEIKKKVIGKSHEESGIFTFEEEFEILSVDESGYPNKILVHLPVGTDPNLQDKLSAELTIQLGRGRPWEVDLKSGGWNIDKRIAYFELLDPLPKSASWSAEYVTHPDVQWSWFPLGIGSKGGFEITMKDGKTVRLNGVDVNGAQGKYIAKRDGIEIGSDLLNAPQALGAGVTGGGKSVLLNNVENACLLRADKWALMICDMKRVEGSRFLKFGVPVGVTYEECASILQFAQATMMERYDEMVKYGVNDYERMPEDKKGQAIMVIVDEAAELLAPITGKDDLSKENATYQAQCLQAIESIYRLGRAAQVHCMTFAQRPSSSDSGISMTIRQNSSTRIGCGNLPSTISTMVFEDNFGKQIPSTPKGRVGIMVNNKQMLFQGFYASEDWLEEYLIEKGLPLEVYENSTMLERYNELQEEGFFNKEAELSDDEFEKLENLL